MNEISIIMPTYNAEKHINEAIDSVLKQTFDKYEFIIIDDGSTDKTVSIIRSYQDERIKLIENKHNFIESLNIGLNTASGKYIVRMDADDIMHIDRLRIQYAIMEEEPSITVCGSWVIPFGSISNDIVFRSVFGLIEYPILKLLNGNIFYHPTIIIRTSFLRNFCLKYEHYEYAEDYKLWFEIAKRGGIFYIESQSLLKYRISEEQISNQKRDKQNESSLKIRREILDYLISINYTDTKIYFKILDDLLLGQKEGIISEDDIYHFFYNLFIKNKNKLILS